MQYGRDHNNEQTRIRHRQMPGDLSRTAKIRMREKQTPFFYFPWQEITNVVGKSFRSFLKFRSKKRQRARDKTLIDG